LIAASESLPHDERQRALLEEARGALSSVADLAELQAANDPGNFRVLFNLVDLVQHLCHCLMELGRRAEATSAFRRLVSVQKALRPRQLIDSGTAEQILRETARTVLAISTCSAHDATSRPEDLVRATFDEMELKPQSEAELGWYVTLAESETAARMRRTGQQEDAKKLVSQMVKYSRELTTRSPQDPLAHLALSEVYVQVAKNAYRYKDANPEQALRHALDSAERALALDPANSKAKGIVTDRRGRLEKLRSGK
jgi:tetratricopeptide (TPR) repeat protein